MIKKPGKPKSSGLIKILKNGPYEVTGGIPLKKQIVVSDQKGIPVKWGSGSRLRPGKKYYLCRCGHSADKPYCDGTHKKIKFQGSESASRARYSEQAETTSGPTLELKDAHSLCSAAGFCSRAGDTWTLTENSANKEARKIAVQEAADCPSGRLVAVDKKTRRDLEPKLKPGISLVEDPYRNTSGPLWIKGGISVKSSKGWKYEIRNRVTLCRCGRSINKPFCDGSHMPFNDGNKSVN